MNKENDLINLLSNVSKEDFIYVVKDVAKYQIKKSVRKTYIFGIFCIVLGVLPIIAGLIFYLHLWGLI